MFVEIEYEAATYLRARIHRRGQVYGYTGTWERLGAFLRSLEVYFATHDDDSCVPF